MLALAFLATGLAAQGPQDRTTSPAPIGGFDTWFAAADYPSAARARGKQDRVSVQVFVDESGKPTDCVITTTSGSVALDATTCAIIMKVGQFTPARDSNGKVVASSYSQSVRWTLPDRAMSPRLSSNHVTKLKISADDVLLSCETLVNGLPPALPKQDECSLYRNGPSYMYHGMKGKFGSTAAVITMQTLLQFPAGPPFPELYKNAGADLLALRRMSFRILPDGSASDRQTVEMGGSLGAPPEPADALFEQMFGHMQPVAGRTDDVTFLTTISAASAD